MNTPAALPEFDRISYVRKVMTLENKIKSQINTFYWIAALSVINSIVYFTGGKISFVIGLAFTQIVDVFSSRLAKRLSSTTGSIIQVFGILIDILLAGLFVLIGYFGLKYHKKTIIAGIVLYALDGLLLLVLQDWFAFLFHVWMLVLLIRGLISIITLKKLQASVMPGYIQSMPAPGKITPGNIIE
jgi:hypothetical protein